MKIVDFSICIDNDILPDPLSFKPTIDDLDHRQSFPRLAQFLPSYLMAM